MQVETQDFASPRSCEEPAWLVGVRCPLDVVEARQRSRKNTPPADSSRGRVFAVEQVGDWSIAAFNDPTCG